MKHVKHWLTAAFVVVAAAVPAILADPSFAHYVAQHPWMATYLPIVVGIVHAVFKAAKPSPAATA